MKLCELCQREVVDISTGANLGRVDDIVFEEASATITSLVLYGRLRLFGLLGREEDTLIPWADIQKIGSDVVLVRAGLAAPARQKKFGFRLP